MGIKFDDIPMFPRAFYEITVGWDYLEEQIERSVGIGLNMDPDFQRGHVWTENQKRAYVEYMLRGGEVARNIYINAPDWNNSSYKDSELIDGKQRITAVIDFLQNRLTVFDGNYRKDFSGRMRTTSARFNWCVVALPTRSEVLQLYLNINAGGTPHSPEEIERVRNLLRQ